MNQYIKEWLKSDTTGDWRIQISKPNCFTDYKLGRALYVYDNCVKFWDDVRVHSDVRKYKLPKNKEELFSILNSGKLDMALTGRAHDLLIECISLYAPSAPSLPNRL